MIFTERQITVRKGKATIDEPVILYRGDYEVSIKFTIMESKFRFKSGVNLVDSEKASFGQLAILAPYGGNVFSEIVKCEDGAVTFTLTKEMIDQLEEVGLYSFQIRLFDYYRESRVSIPPVEFGIEVREPVASEDHDNEVNNAIVGYSIAKVVDPKNEKVGPTFDNNGNYNKTDWKTGDRITEGKLDKIEVALDKINQNEISDVAALDKRVTSNYNVLDAKIDEVATKGTTSDVIEKATKEEIEKQIEGGRMANLTIADYSITPEKLSTLYIESKLSNNLLNPNKLTYGCHVHPDGSIIKSYDELCVTDFIKIDPSKTYYLRIKKSLPVHPFAFYDDDFKIVDTSIIDYNSHILEPPPQASYIRFTLSVTDIPIAFFEEVKEYNYYTQYKESLSNDAISGDNILYIADEVNLLNNTLYPKLKTGKNLFDKNAVTKGKVISYIDGEIKDEKYTCISDYIRVEPDTQYTISHLNQMCFYDADKNFIIGGTDSTFITPKECRYVIIGTMIRNLELQQFEKGGNSTEYESYGSSYMDDDYLDMHYISEKLYTEELFIKGHRGKNLFNKDTVIRDSYMSHESGLIVSVKGASYSDYIKVEPNTQYTGSHINQMCFLGSDKEFLSGLVSPTTFVTPSNCHYVVITTMDKNLELQQLELGDKTTSYEHYIACPMISLESITPELRKQINGNRIIITVNPAGGADYTSLREAVDSITNNSESNRYEIRLHEGEYDIQSYYSQTEIENSSFIGLIIPAYVDLIGIGNVDKTIIKWEFSSSTSSTLFYRISPLNLKGEGKIENLTVIGRNTRYAVHDDWSFPNQSHYAKNCKFYKYGLGLPKAYGAGIWSGMKYIFEDCYFYTDSTEIEPYACHNNEAQHFTNPSLQRFINCTFSSAGNRSSLGFGSMGSNQNDSIELINCTLNGRIRLYEELSNGVGCDFKLSLIGCNSVPLNVTVSDSNHTWVPNFITNEVKEMKNGSNEKILKGDPVSLSINEGSVAAFNGFLYGIALEDIEPNSLGKVRNDGYLSEFECGKTFTAGQKIGVENGELMVTESNYIGYVPFNGFMKFI